jgi:hypothetical protein
MKAMFTLTSAESKRLIAKGVVRLPEVQAALQEGLIFIAGGTTNAFVAEELTGMSIEKGHYTAGVISKGVHCMTDPAVRKQPIVLRDGQPVEMTMPEALEAFRGRDVFIKGGNAVDLDGNVGVMVGEPWGGTIGRSMGRLMTLGAKLIMPVGLEKLIPSVPAAANFAGLDEVDYTLGMRIGIIPVTYGRVMTELDALELLADLDEVVHVSSGGVGGSEGAVTLGITGETEEVQKVMELVRSIKGEPALQTSKRKCGECRSCHFGRGE